MPKLSIDKNPKYRKHKASGQAVVTLNGTDVYLGPWGTRASREEYDRAISEWRANGRQLDVAGQGLTVEEVLARFWDYYLAKLDRKQTPHRGNYISKRKAAFKPLRLLYGKTLAKDFGPLALKAVRDQQVATGIVRRTVNCRIGWVLQVFKWAVAEELIPPSVYHGLNSLEPLLPGDSDAKDRDPVKPVPDAHVDAILPHVPPAIAAMIQVQRLTGMRPGEVMIMRGCDIDTAGIKIDGVVVPVWAYRPFRHKTQHHGKTRTIILGPRAQAVLRPWLKPDLQAFLFSPRDSIAAAHARRRERAKDPSKLRDPALRRSPKRNKKRMPHDCYLRPSYCAAITTGCRRAGVPHWHPHQLRHTAATEIRKEFGIEVARIILGHSHLRTTEIYAEANNSEAAKAMRKLG